MSENSSEELKEEIRSLLNSAKKELENEGLEPDILLAGPGFIKSGGAIAEELGLKVYLIDELEYDALVADSRYLGQMKKAMRRISVEPMVMKERIWDEMASI